MNKQFYGVDAAVAMTVIYYYTRLNSAVLLYVQFYTGLDLSLIYADRAPIYVANC